jgi:hypothetical protein
VRAARIVALVLLFTTAAGVEAARLSSLSAVSQGNVWSHLRTGQCILENHHPPHEGMFSQAGKLPWIATSWAYDVLLAGLYRLLDLRAIPVLMMCYRTALAILVFFLAGGIRGRFWPAVALSAAAQYVLAGVGNGPVDFSILCFATELFLLVESRINNARLLWLPALLLAWANLDLHFVYGIAVLVLFLGGLAIQQALNGRQSGGSLRIAGIAVLLSITATVLTPYFYHPYGVFFAGFHSAAKDYFPDYRAMTFHRPQDYAVLLLTMTAFLALGMRRTRDPFFLATLAGCTLLSFYSQGDTWVVTLASIATIAWAIGDGEASAEVPWRSWQGVAVAAVILVIWVGAFARIPKERRILLAKASESYPVEASIYIREHGLPQPMFNNYEWGGFLDWYLPEYSAAIDDRAELFGDEFIVQYSQAMDADIPYSAFPAMNQARTLVLPVTSLMGEAFSNISGFEIAYKDKVAVVLTKENASSGVPEDQKQESQVKP